MSPEGATLTTAGVGATTAQTPTPTLATAPSVAETRPALELVILIGLQAVGKSTFYAGYFAATHVHISKDLLRSNARPERRQTQLITEALAAGRSVVVDNTNATVADRATLIQLGRAAGAVIIGYYFPTTVGASLTRNRQRTGRARGRVCRMSPSSPAPASLRRPPMARVSTRSTRWLSPTRARLGSRPSPPMRQLASMRTRRPTRQATPT